MNYFRHQILAILLNIENTIFIVNEITNLLGFFKINSKK